MRPVMQTRFPDVAAGVRGNCLTAVVASLLELELDDVPHFVQDDVDSDGEKNWWAEMVRFVQRRGYELVTLHLEAGYDHPTPKIGEYYTVTGVSPRDPNIHHIVIYRDGVLVHDPHPDGTGLSWIDQPTQWTLRKSETPRCAACGGAMEPAFALACGKGGRSERIALPPACRSRSCAAARDKAALEAAIAAGVVDP